MPVLVCLTIRPTIAQNNLIGNGTSAYRVILLVSDGTEPRMRHGAIYIHTRIHAGQIVHPSSKETREAPEESSRQRRHKVHSDKQNYSSS